MRDVRPAFGEMLANHVELGAIEFRPDPPDAGLEKAARTYGILRLLNLVNAPIDSLDDCFAVTVRKRHSTDGGAGSRCRPS